MKAHKAAETEYLGILKSGGRIKYQFPGRWRGTEIVPKDKADKNKTYKPYMPREYGGRVCEKCIIDKDGKKVYEYYLTQGEGPFPVIQTANINLLLDTPPCNKGDKIIGYWHTHPSKLARNNRKFEQQYPGNVYYWGAASSFSQPDKDFVGNDMQNPTGSPIFVTRRAQISRMAWNYVTEGYNGRKIVDIGRTPKAAETVTLPNGIRP